jgi:hypothetical protein
MLPISLTGGFTSTTKKGKTSLVTAKCRLRELVGVGNPYLKSSHMVAWLDLQCSKIKDINNIDVLITQWVSQPNTTFALEWKHL